jgi:hypothetical protein
MLPVVEAPLTPPDVVVVSDSPVRVGFSNSPVRVGLGLVRISPRGQKRKASPRKVALQVIPQQRPGQPFISRFFQPISKIEAQIRLEKQQAVVIKAIEERVAARNEKATMEAVAVDAQLAAKKEARRRKKAAKRGVTARHNVAIFETIGEMAAAKGLWEQRVEDLDEEQRWSEARGSYFSWSDYHQELALLAL